MISETADNDELFAKLSDLVKNEKTEQVISIARSSVPANLGNYLGMSLLHLAAKYDNVELIEFLLSSGHDIECKTCYGETPLLMSAKHNSYMAVKSLLNANADMFAADDNNVNTLRVLLSPRRHLPTDVYKHVGYRLRGTADVVDKMLGIFTEAGAPLESASMFEYPKLMKFVLETRGQTIDYERMIELSVELGHVENIRVLMQHRYKSWERKEILMKKLAKMMTSPNTNLECLKPIVEKLIDWRVINKAAIKQLDNIFIAGNRQAVQMMIDHDIDLHVRSTLGRDFLMEMFRNPNVDVIELLKHRFDANEQNMDGYSLLHLAVRFKPIGFIRRLLDLGANPNAKNNYGKTALFYVTDPDCMELLLQRGADVELIDNNGRTIIKEMKFEPYVLDIVVAHLASRDKCNRQISQQMHDIEKVNKLYERCTWQLQWMSQYKIYKEHTLFALFKATDNELMLYRVVNRNSVNDILNYMRDNRFSSYYISVLEQKLTKAYQFHALRFDIAETVSELIGVYDPNHLVTEKVLSFLSCKDILACV